jgi:hypothetical protein
LILLGFSCLFWLGLLTATKRQNNIGGIYLALALATVLGLANVHVLFRLQATSVGPLALQLVATVSYLVGGFAAAYWDRGSTENFNVPLTHLDALYFAVGTFTTAGTGNIAAISDSARGVQTLQMTLGLGVVVFAASVVVTRYTSAPRMAPGRGMGTKDDAEPH